MPQEAHQKLVSNKLQYTTRTTQQQGIFLGMCVPLGSTASDSGECWVSGTLGDLAKHS